MNPKEIGQKIKNARKSKGMTLVELGELIGVGKSVVSKYENGEIINIPRERMTSLHNVLEIPYSELLGLEEENILESIIELNLNKEQLEKLEEFARFLKFSE